MRFFLSPTIGTGTTMEDPLRPLASDLLKGMEGMSWSCFMMDDGMALVCVDMQDETGFNNLLNPAITPQTQQQAHDILISHGIEDTIVLNANSQ